MRLVVLVALLGSFACGSSPVTPMSDLSTSSAGDLALYSVCGHPGDTGNSKGVGKFCMDTLGCSNQPAFACSTLMPIAQGPIYFCTLACDPNAPNPDSVCGENSSCTCLSASLCGCVPTVCRVGLFG